MAIPLLCVPTPHWLSSPTVSPANSVGQPHLSNLQPQHHWKFMSMICQVYAQNRKTGILPEQQQMPHRINNHGIDLNYAISKYIFPERTE